MGVNSKLKIIENNLTVAPNPSIDKITLNFKLEQNSPIKLNIISLNGTLMSQEDLGSFSFGERNVKKDITGLPSGMYILEMETNFGVMRKKIIKK